jgi:23S rRNA pseudouridine2605 synthase
MDDERKKPPRGKPGSKPSGAGRDRTKSGGGRDGARKFGGAKEGARSGGPTGQGDRKPFVRRERSADGEQRAERKPFLKRDDERADKPFRRPFVKREGGDPERSFKPRDGDRKPFVRRERSADGEQRAERRPFVKRDDERADKPFRKPFVKREGGDPDRSFKPREGDRKPFVRRERAADGERPAISAEADAGSERIAKRLARAGLASRRDAEALIAAGRIKVNGKVLDSPAFNVTTVDRIELDGAEIPAIERTRLFVFHKPAGLVTTNRDPEGRRTVFDVLPEGLPRLMTVGRLDINTEGLLLLTNDGGLSRVMELPATGWLRRYRVRVHGEVDEQALADLRDGVAVDGVFYGAIEAQLDRAQGTNAWLTIGLREGKNREVKNVLGSLGLDVTRLIRISYGPFQLGELPEGHVMEIRGRTLREQLGERLIEESGANFDADIAAPFPNRPVRRGYEDKQPDRPRSERRDNLREGEGGLIKNFRRDRDRKRTDALDRLSTSRDSEAPRFRKRDDAPPRGKPAGDRPRLGGKGKSEDREETPQPDKRRVNVWMAPGARPQGKRPSEKAAERRPDDRRPEGRPLRKSEGMRGDRPRGDRPSGAPGRSRSDGPKPDRSGSGGRPSRGKPPRGKS